MRIWDPGSEIKKNPDPGSIPDPQHCCSGRLPFHAVAIVSGITYNVKRIIIQRRRSFQVYGPHTQFFMMLLGYDLLLPLLMMLLLLVHVVVVGYDVVVIGHDCVVHSYGVVVGYDVVVIRL
jgi:hypothetical protein